MYEYKVFDTRTGQEVPDVDKLLPPHTSDLAPDGVQPINNLLKHLVAEGWEPMDVDYVGRIVFCRRALTLTD